MTPTTRRLPARLLPALALLAVAPALAAPRFEGGLPRRGERPLDHVPGVETVYGVLTTADGARLRTLLTRPAGAAGPLPAVLFVQWLSCDSIELPTAAEDGWTRMLRRVAAESGLVMMRTEKAGVGDSEGPPCAELGYETELAHHRDALAALAAHPWVDPRRVVVYGASMGATMAPLVARGHDVAGVVVWGGGAKTWLERTLGFERRRRELTGVPAERLTREMRLLSRFLPRYLEERRRPREIAAADPRLAGVWEAMTGTDGETHYGRSLAFHQEAQAQDWAAAWAAVTAPVLVLYGEHDWYEDSPGHALIARLVERAGGRARFRVLPGLDHHFVRFPTAEAAAGDGGGEVAEGPAVDEILAWLREVVGP